MLKQFEEYVGAEAYDSDERTIQEGDVEPQRLI